MGSHGDAGSVAYWRSLWEAERDELARSSQVQQKLQAVVQTLRQKSDGLEAEVAELRAAAPPDPRCEELQAELEEAADALARSEARRQLCASEAAAQRHELREHEGRAAASRAALEESRAAGARLAEACRRAAERREEALARARSMVTADALARAAAEAGDLRGQLLEHEAEAARLRQALADSWAARGEPGEQAAGAGGAAGQEKQEEGPALESLDDVEEQLRWLAGMQQQASAEVHHVLKLERTEAALQARLREVSEQQAALRSERVDLGCAGRAMREAMATQSEISVARASELEEARRSTDEDRVKLISEIADAQARLEVLAPELRDLAELEGRHARLSAERKALADASQRLRDVNGALGVLLLGDTGSPSAATALGGEGDSATQAAGALTRTLQLHQKFSERSEAHRLEKQKLADRIQALEVENARSGAVPPDAARPRASAGGARAAPAGADPPAGGSGALSSAREAASVAQAAAASAWRGGLERLKDGAATLGL